MGERRDREQNHIVSPAANSVISYFFNIADSKLQVTFYSLGPIHGTSNLKLWTQTWKLLKIFCLDTLAEFKSKSLYKCSQYLSR